MTFMKEAYRNELLTRLLTSLFLIGLILYSSQDAYSQVGLVSHWTGDGNANDAVGGNNGTLFNGASYAPGVIGQAFAFDGVDDYLQAPSTGLPTGGTDRTLAMWAKIDSVVTAESFFSGYGAFGTPTSAYLLGATGSTSRVFFSQWGGNISGTTLQNGVWYHVAVKNQGNIATLYVNGMVAGTAPLNIATSEDPQRPFYAGRIGGPFGDTRRLHGNVDDIRVYNRALSSGEILSLATVSTASSLFDFDGDRRSDISVFRPSDGAWYLQQSTAGFFGVSFGAAEDKIAPADYDGDGKTDVTVYRPSTGVWYITRSSDGNVSYAVFGIAEDLPTPADYDGDGKADVSVFRPSSGTWYRLNSSDGGFVAVQFGADGDRPTIGDYDNDGRADLGVFRPSTGAWYQTYSSNGFLFGEQFGISTDRITPADYDGDGKTDIAIYRPSEGLWYVKNSATTTYVPYVFGLADDLPVPADFDGDGKADIGVFRPSDGTWYIVNSSTGGFTIFQFGQNGDQPTQSAFAN